MNPVIEVKKVSKVFRSKGVEMEALKDIDLEIQRGEIFGIIGMSGAGKSTLVRCLNYLERPTSGNVLIEGEDLGELSEAQLRLKRREISMIFQHFNLLMQKKVLDNIAFPLLIQGVKKAEARRRAQELLQTVGLSDKANAYPAQLSGGQKQRVAIARALAVNPKILLCDEATSALDPQTTESILDLLQEINRRYGITIVIITHEMAVVRKICTHVAIVEKGEIIEQGAMVDIFNHPKSKKARELIIGQREDDSWPGEKRQKNLLEKTGKIRIVFSENSAFEPVIGNMVLKFGTPVNILKADTKNVGGVAKGEMILGVPEDPEVQRQMKEYLSQRGLEIEEVTEDVE
ncbi:ATP-binding cassette domain-containing protein [Aminipila butyrica]|uniref:ATP-binding cassette domain-containing protein n=1 Tax=Aminipila butyrica TaxID=433296 RepID=A0A858BWA4_9FIRM|nr:ATP-binding cassette domain-containing protein [Aminipila butyrica]QIB70361.1 ATP-binding cassette domain-containing protein [Aminipila butyrica]